MAVSITSPVGSQPVPITLLFSIKTALVVEEPESTPIVRPSCFSRASRLFLATMVDNASILMNSSSALVLSVNEYVTTGKLVFCCMNLLISFLTNAPSAHLKQVAIKTASAFVFPSTIDVALAIISLIPVL